MGAVKKFRQLKLDGLLGLHLGICWAQICTVLGIPEWPQIELHMPPSLVDTKGEAKTLEHLFKELKNGESLLRFDFPLVPMKFVQLITAATLQLLGRSSCKR